MKVKITDVARESGVSIATVSHVINKTRYVSADTTKKVEDAIQKLGYSPNLNAQNLKKGRKGLIGVIVPDISSVHHSLILDQLETVTSPQYHTIVSNSRYSVQRELEQIRIFSAGVVDGLVISSAAGDFEEIASAIKGTFPVVFISRPIKNCPYPSLIISSYSAVYQGVEELIRQGHTQIGYIADQANLSFSIERLDAYRQAVKDYRLEIGDSLITYSEQASKTAYFCAEELIAKKCTAIVVSNNFIARETLKYLNLHQLQVGRDVELLGFSGSDWYGYRTEEIAQVSQPTQEMARMAGQRLLELIEEPKREAHTIVLHSTYLPKNKQGESTNV